MCLDAHRRLFLFKGMIERGTNKCRFFPVAKRDAATLLPLIAANINQHTLIGIYKE
jgi:hypothetical protein